MVMTNEDGPQTRRAAHRGTERQSQVGQAALQQDADAASRWVPATGVQHLTGAEIVWEALLREGVDTVFGYPGGAIMPTYDAMPKYPIRHILVRHEQGASHMADGYARASGEVGVCIATSGPGATNLVTGIATAMLDSVPMVAITGQVPSTLLGTDAFQETDITGVTLPITKHGYLVTDVADLAETLREAFHIARSGRPGPVIVDICKDAQIGSTDVDWDALGEMREANRHLPGTDRLEAGLEEALALIETAEKPLILAGAGVIASGADEALLEFCDRTGIPVASTLLGLGGFPASHPLALGMMGMHGEAWVNQAIQSADLLLAVGMRFDDRVTGRTKDFAPRARKIHVELDPAEVNKTVKVDVALIGDAKHVLTQLYEKVEPRGCASWVSQIQAMREDADTRVLSDEPTDRDAPLLAAHAMHALNRLADSDTVVVTDVGQHQMWEAQIWQHESPRTLLTSGGLGTMGFALPAGMGAKVARPDAEVFVIAGDGGFQMTSMELSTIAQESVKLVICIINNGYLGMVRQWQEFFYNGRYVATPLTSPDFVMLAQAHGVDAQRVETLAQLEAALEAAKASDSATLLDIRVIEEDAVYPMVPAGETIDSMIRRPVDAAPESTGNAATGNAAAAEAPAADTPRGPIGIVRAGGDTPEEA